MAKKTFLVVYSSGGRTVEAETEAESAAPKRLDDGMLQIGDVLVRAGALIAVHPKPTSE